MIGSGRAGQRTSDVIPPLAGWSSFPGAFLNLLVIGLAALAGEWLVHQTQYAIEYGSRFGHVMATTPHHLYMAPAGFGLALISLALLVASGVLIRIADLSRRRLVRLLPARLQQVVPQPDAQLPWRAVTACTFVLATAQAAIYVVQENLESAAEGQGLPGLFVLFGGQHATVVPLHLIAALCLSLILWTVADHLKRGRQSVRVVELLVRAVVPGQTTPESLAPAAGHVPDLRIVAGVLGLRSPPLPA